MSADLRTPVGAARGKPMIEVEQLVKRYSGASTDAVAGVSFAVRQSEIFALLGPNGAGKTTTVGMLTTRVVPTGGKARLAGIDVVDQPVRARAALAVVPQRINLDRSLSIRQNLLFHAAYHGVPTGVARSRAQHLLERFELTDHADHKADLLSGGQAQRVLVARALMHNPQVLFLDEPTTGLDPAVRLFVWESIRELRDQGVAMVLTTHDMREAAELSDRVAIMDGGKLLVEETPERLVSTLPGTQTLDLTLDTAPGSTALVAALKALPNAVHVEQIGEAVAAAEDTRGQRERLRLRLYVDGDAPTLVVPVAEVLSEHGAVLTDITIGRPNLEDVFLHHTGRTLR
uniref:Putative ABC transporter n=1 Tax=Streptomyces argenteolus TaxID=67274 RepID=A9ZNV9_9ACTN|nr:putative ABC transporter [Streptomyces argenteolus]